MNDAGRVQDRDRMRPRARWFQTTRWSIVLSAREGDAAGASLALAELCETYWYPLYAFVRRRGYDADSAQDLVQGFLARLLEKDDLAGVDRAKGKFRSFLMAACSHYLANQADHARALKRGGGQAPISIDRLVAEGRYGGEPTHNLTAERLFDRQWALALLDTVLNSLSVEMSRDGKTSHFEALRPTLQGGAERIPYRVIAAELNLTEEAARAAAHRLRRRYRKLLREEVAGTLADPDDLDEEIRSLFASLAE